MYIQSLDIEYNDEFIISDIDDCLIKTSESIRKHKINKRAFYFNNDVYNKNKQAIFLNIELTKWGEEFIELIKNKIITKFILITAAKNRLDLLTKIFPFHRRYIYENMLNEKKIEFLNSFKYRSIYVDDKMKVIKRVTNPLINSINYPKLKIHRQRFKMNRLN